MQKPSQEAPSPARASKTPNGGAAGPPRLPERVQARDKGRARAGLPDRGSQRRGECRWGVRAFALLCDERMERRLGRTSENKTPVLPGEREERGGGTGADREPGQPSSLRVR